MALSCQSLTLSKVSVDCPWAPEMRSPAKVAVISRDLDKKTVIQTFTSKNRGVNITTFNLSPILKPNFFHVEGERGVEPIAVSAITAAVVSG